MADDAPLKALVLDANIVIRAVLGQRVRGILEAYYDRVRFFAPQTAFADARQYLPELLRRRGIDIQAAMEVLDRIGTIVQPIELEEYGEFEQLARQRVRDVDDWQVLALALALNAPVWTEDADFFGSGVATWTTDRVEVFLKG